MPTDLSSCPTLIALQKSVHSCYADSMNFSAKADLIDKAIAEVAAVIERAEKAEEECHCLDCHKHHPVGYVDVERFYPADNPESEAAHD